MSARIAEQPAYQRPVGEILAALGTDARYGLSEAEAQRRLRCHGRNELFAEPPLPRWRRFIAQFQDALVILLLIATAISAGLWLYEPESALPYEAITIAAIVLLNAVMGYVQQSRAQAALAALRQMAAAQASVVRGRGTAQRPGNRDRPRRHHPCRGRGHDPSGCTNH